MSKRRVHPFRSRIERLRASDHRELQLFTHQAVCNAPPVGARHGVAEQGQVTSALNLTQIPRAIDEPRRDKLKSAGSDRSSASWHEPPIDRSVAWKVDSVDTVPNGHKCLIRRERGSRNTNAHGMDRDRSCVRVDFLSPDPFAIQHDGLWCNRLLHVLVDNDVDVNELRSLDCIRGRHSYSHAFGHPDGVDFSSRVRSARVLLLRRFRRGERTQL
jgi:hypothetical protein